jgi:ribosomal protein S18 acetylase RimI-like enzyme
VELRVEPDLDPRIAVALAESVRRETVLRTEHGDERGLAVLARHQGAVCGGAVGWTWGGCCELETLWVQPDLRRQGLGGRLLAAAEDESLARGCRQLVVFTHGIQAPGFYEQRGYELVGRVEDYPQGSVALWYRKLLVGGSSSGAGDVAPAGAP